ncbi:hypothetical protein NDU88_004715 [Pleurodeles waltl]|uniref:Uncharacterized protein n=1 Tax=Pleurodeles waltl TaxID=8319 RepID=A0AAV7UHU8_PLEWA|nr:hypothetical protein NDU88_004715 [Pleurodeles waltl]
MRGSVQWRLGARLSTEPAAERGQCWWPTLQPGRTRWAAGGLRQPPEAVRCAGGGAPEAGGRCLSRSAISPRVVVKRTCGALPLGAAACGPRRNPGLETSSQRRRGPVPPQI